MAVVQVTLPSPPGPVGAAYHSTPHATITHPTYGTVTIPATDPAADFDDATPEWVQVPRPGRDPLLLPKGNKLRVFTLLVTLFGPDDSSDQAEQLAALIDKIAYDRQPIVCSWGGLESGTYQITEFVKHSVKRRSVDNHIVWLNGTLQLTAASSVPPTPGEPPPIAKVPSPSTQPAAAANNPPRRYTVKAGDTLYGISIQVYGTGARWTDIASANSISDPRSLQVGQVLTIPA